jgi:hypothetical protein
VLVVAGRKCELHCFVDGAQAHRSNGVTEEGAGPVIPLASSMELLEHGGQPAVTGEREALTGCELQGSSFPIPSPLPPPTYPSPFQKLTDHQDQLIPPRRYTVYNGGSPYFLPERRKFGI